MFILCCNSPTNAGSQAALLTLQALELTQPASLTSRFVLNLLVYLLAIIYILQQQQALSDSFRV